MTNKQWDEWMNLHCRLVCVQSKLYREMLTEWRKALEAYDVADLEAASRWFVESWYPNHPESQWGAHPGIIKRKVVEIFSLRRKREELKESLGDKKPLSFAAEGNRSKVLGALRGVGKPGEAKS